MALVSEARSGLHHHHQLICREGPRIHLQQPAVRRKTDGESFVVSPPKLTLSNPPMEDAGQRRHGFYFPQASTKLHCTDRPQDGSSLFFPNRESIEMKYSMCRNRWKMSEAPLFARRDRIAGNCPRNRAVDPPMSCRLRAARHRNRKGLRLAVIP